MVNFTAGIWHCESNKYECQTDICLKCKPADLKVMSRPQNLSPRIMPTASKIGAVNRVPSPLRISALSRGRGRGGLVRGPARPPVPSLLPFAFNKPVSPKKSIFEEAKIN